MFCAVPAPLRPHVHLVTLVHETQNMSAYMDHYVRWLGVPLSNIRLFVHRKTDATPDAMLETRRGAPQTLYTGPYHSNEKRTLVNRHLQTLDSDALVMSLDADEHAFLPCAGMPPPMALCGVMVDRHDARCARVRAKLGGYDRKIVLARARRNGSALQYASSHSAFFPGVYIRSGLPTCDGRAAIEHLTATNTAVRLNALKREVYRNDTTRQRIYARDPTDERLWTAHSTPCPSAVT